VFANIKTIVEVLTLVLTSIKYIKGEISEAKYNSSIKERRENYKKFMEGSRADRLEVLRDENT